MKVLTYLKDLPVKLTNENQGIISLEGATLYIDEESNRYAYVCFNNHRKKPFFAMILELSQYDIGGHLIKKEKYYVPNCYGNRGKTLLEQPINIDKECEGMEININLAVYSSKIFAGNALVNKNAVKFSFPRLSDQDPLMPNGSATNFAFPEDKPTSQPVQNESSYYMDQINASLNKPTEEKKEEPAPEFDFDSVKHEEPVKEESKTEEVKEEVVKEEVKAEETPVTEEKKEDAVDVNSFAEEDNSLDNDLPVAYPLPMKSSKLFHVVLPIVIGVLAVGLTLLVYFIVRGQVPATPYRP